MYVVDRRTGGLADFRCSTSPLSSNAAPARLFMTSFKAKQAVYNTCFVLFFTKQLTRVLLTRERPQDPLSHHNLTSPYPGSYFKSHSS